MSIQLINQYYNRREKLIQYGGSRNELSIRDAFRDLLNHYADKKNLMLISEIRVQGTKGEKVQPDGTLKNALRLDYGYWESKDEKDNIDDEIETKIRKGYPLTNILFEDGITAVLFQHGEPVERIDISDRNKLDKILTRFISYEHPQVREFNEALGKFKEDLPDILDALRDLLVKQSAENKEYVEARDAFLEHCRHEINPDFTPDDVREMIIQHILTEEIFNAVFDESHFHRENNIARELEKVMETFFTGSIRRNLLDHIQHYYKVISNAARNIPDHHEKQKFLKVIYENFYKTYNPKAADRLGVVYTPNEIVKFMVESTDYLLQKHFRKTLADKNVEILDPATGTGTFICDIIDYIPKVYLNYKYKNEIHANEVAILPYYVANLNIEYTYKQRMGIYDEFPNLCFVDTLDNTGALKYKGQQHQLFGFSSENAERIKRQNEKKISVIIGNPPYNANQKNENENNKNRDYPAIDERIKKTFIANSTAQKTKMYDMYARFYRWAMDRIERNGIIALITNRSFINSRTFDGFRKTIQEDFQYALIIDTKSDVRMNPKIAGTTHNVFGIQTGVAVMFLVRKENVEHTDCEIYYTTMDEYLRKEEKLQWFSDNKFEKIPFLKITPDKNFNWINLGNVDFNPLIPFCSKFKNQETLFLKNANGISTNRDEWVYDFDKNNLIMKSKFFIDEYNNELLRWNKYKKDHSYVDIKDESNPILDRFLGERNQIKWSKMIKRDKLRKNKKGKFDESKIIECNYRFFVKQFLYNNYIPIDIKGQQDEIFLNSNKLISVNGPNSVSWEVFSFNTFIDLNVHKGGSKLFPLYWYTENGTRTDNITDWGLEQFQKHYAPGGHAEQGAKKILKRVQDDCNGKKITREDIFHYVYGVLHNPAYIKKYELNLKREFPRIPFYKDFWKWAKWGKDLMGLHINYEDEKEYILKRIDEKPKEKKEKQKTFFPKVKEPEAMFSTQAKIKAKLKADKQAGTIEIDEITKLKGIPKEAWEYKLGNRSALEWILDQYKEKKSKDKTIAAKFNTYRFADYKEHVIQLLKKVTTVSVETMKIIKEMEKELEK